MRSNSLKREMQSNVRWCLGIIGVALMASPMFFTNDQVAISATHAVQAISLCCAGVLLVKTQVEAAFCKPR